MTDGRLSELKSLLANRGHSTSAALWFAQKSGEGMEELIEEVEQLRAQQLQSGSPQTMDNYILGNNPPLPPLRAPGWAPPWING